MLRTVILCLLLTLAGLLAAPLAAAPTGPGAYKIGGVAVDVVAPNPGAARDAAYHEAERRAWPLLWARLTGGLPAAAPRLSDGTIESMVAGVEIEAERFSLTRYIGRLAIVFDRDRASGYLGGAFGGAPPPMLLLPVMVDGGVRTVYQTKTPWLAAWLRFRDAASALDYVIPAASAGDNLVLTAYQTRRGNRDLWRNILSRFSASDVLTAELILDRSFPGGPVGAMVIARHGPDAVELGRLKLRAANPAGLDAMLDDAVRAADTIYVRALQNGQLAVEKGLTIELAPIIGSSPVIGLPGAAAAATGGTEANVVTADAKSWGVIEAQLRATPTVTGVGLLSLALGGTSRIVIRHGDSDEMLAYQFDRRGFRLAPDAGGVLLRRKVPGDPAVPPPTPPVGESDTVTAGDTPPGSAAKPLASSPAAKPSAPKPPRPADPLAPY